MTEVAPAKPDVKPKPKREEPKPKPRRGDPWTVPAPRVNPTPKATKEKNMKKMLITSIADYRVLKMAVSEKSFNEKFVVSMEVTSLVIAEEAMTNLYFEDSRAMTAEEMKAFKCGKF